MALPLLFDPLRPGAGTWVVVPLARLHRLSSLRRTGAVAFLGLAEQLAAEADPAARMDLRHACLPTLCLVRIAGERATLPLRARAMPVPGCGERLRHLPRLDTRWPAVASRVRGSPWRITAAEE